MPIICSKERVANMLSVTRIVIIIGSKRPTIFTLTARTIQRLGRRRRVNFQHNILFLSDLNILPTSKTFTSIIIHIVCDKGCHCLEDDVHSSRKKQSIFIYMQKQYPQNPQKQIPIIL